MTKMTRRAVLALAVGALAVTAASVSVAAPKQQLPVAGDYTGTALSAAPNSSEVAVELSLAVGKNRKVSGVLEVLGGEAPVQYNLVGTVSASGQLNLKYKTPGGPNLTLKGKFTDAVPNEDPNLAQPKKIEGTYKFSKGGDRGTFTVTATAP